ncbi:MAG: FliA/WhiG family RNA polymerase sigma factor [Candidatus Kuenenia sp.]|nr:FliA/WhiG family RNA polymerase sigma factor [Candidatus Kuenenia hertensis]
MLKKNKEKSNYKNNEIPDRERLVIENLSLVKYVVNKFTIYLPSFVEKEDLVEYGVIGLLEASERFDPCMDTKFGTFAVSRIRGAILDYLRAQDWLPRSVRDKVSLAREVYATLEQRLNRPPLPEEIAEELKIDTAEWEKLLTEINFGMFLSLEEINAKSEDSNKEGGGKQFADLKMCDPLSNLETEEEKELLVEAIKELPKREKLVITLYYYEGLMLKEISQLLDISESRVSQLHHQGLYMLRSKINKIALK